ncbi:hypothetical protein ABKN59_005518 [Abortiporus biennis]
MRRHHSANFDAEWEVSSEEKKPSAILPLPPEILSYIFLILTDSLTPWKNDHDVVPGSCLRKPPGTRSEVHQYSWVPVITSTCKYWRYVAIDCANLWTTYTLHVPGDIARTWLLRSNEAPLYVRFDWPSGVVDTTSNCTTSRTESIYATMRRVLRHIHRIRILVLDIPSKFYKMLLQCLPWCRQPARLLEVLAVDVSEGDGLQDRFAESSDILQAFTGRELPVLRTLCGYGPFFSWNHHSFNMPQLRRLTIDADYGNPLQYTINEAFTALESMPYLEVLELRDTVPKSYKQHNGLKDRIVNLPNLKHLDILTSSKLCSRFLEHLSFPHTTTLQLHVDLKLKVPRLTSFLETVQNKLYRRDQIHRASYSTIVIDPDFIDHVYDIKLRCYSQNLPASQVRSQFIDGVPSSEYDAGQVIPDLSLAFTFEYDDGADTFPTSGVTSPEIIVIQHTLAMLKDSLTSIKTLVFDQMHDLDVDWSVDASSTGFKYLKEVETISVSEGWLPIVLNFLSEPVDPTSESTSSTSSSSSIISFPKIPRQTTNHIVFPKLKTLEIVGFSFVTRQDTFFPDYLESCLISRKYDAGRRVEKLDLINCANYTNYNLAHLRAWVGGLFFNGVACEVGGVKITNSLYQSGARKRV